MEELPDFRSLERRLDRLSALAEARHDEYARVRADLMTHERFLDIAPKAAQTLEELSTALFGEILDDIEQNLTHAIREVLGQDRVVATEREVKNNRLHINFQIHNQGDEAQIEDILVGQGGSVANILSVGLRLIALSQLEPQSHRPFLVLDEQDCWLRPALVPKFMQLINQIAKRLNVQVLAISHHPIDLFSYATDSILELEPSRTHGAVVKKVK